MSSVDPMTESTTLDENGEFQNSNDLLIEGLSFTEETERQPRQVRITVGSSFDIQCGVAGYPYPDLIWLKVIYPAGHFFRSFLFPRWLRALSIFDETSPVDMICFTCAATRILRTLAVMEK